MDIKKLVDLLNTYRDAYYNRNCSLVSDEVYDNLFDTLAKMEAETGIIYANSPTQTVGYPVLSKLTKVKHDHPLMSLDKTTEVEDFKKYFRNKPAVIMAKMDGLTISIHYENGKLVMAESRGNGEVGEDITHNVKTFANIPLEIPFKGKLIVDGEAIIDYLTFEEINRDEQTEYKNPRNLVSGSVRQLDSAVAAKRKIKFVAWKLYQKINADGTRESNSNDENFEELEKLGFTVVPHILCSDSVAIEPAINMLVAMCKTLHYPIDGIVGMFDDIAYGNDLGMTGHHPKHSLAYKFYQERNETTLLDIEWTTSRTGLINPVAIVEPVEIDGTTVSRATLNNISIIKDLKLGIGDTVTIIKANQIIPKIVENLTQSDTYVIPTECPDCHHPAVIKNDTGRETLYCTNEYCPAKLHDRMSNFCNREGMNIVGLSEERLRMLMDLGYVTDFSSIYNLYTHRAELENLEGYGKSSVDNLLKSIEESKHCRFANVLTAIGIPGIGKSSAKSLAKYCASVKQGGIFDTFINLAFNNFDWTQLEDFGEITSQNINRYIQEARNSILPLADILTIEDDSAEAIQNNKLGGKTFCITGKLLNFANRDSLVEEIEKHGGKIVSGVTAKTNYLITNDKESGSSKNKKAAQYGTQIISEEEFINLCK